MTKTHRYTRYESTTCIDREDANALATHLMALASMLAANGCRLDLDRVDRDTGLHYARMVRVVQRATQPNVVGKAPCPGVLRMIMIVENGEHRAIIETPKAEITVSLTHRTMVLEPRGANEARVIDLSHYRERQRA